MIYQTIEEKARELAQQHAPDIDDLVRELEAGAAVLAPVDESGKARIRARAEAIASSALLPQFMADICAAIERGELTAYAPRTHSPASVTNAKARPHYYEVKISEVNAWYAKYSPRVQMDSKRREVHMAADVRFHELKDAGRTVTTNKEMSKELAFRKKIKKSDGELMDQDTIRKHLNKAGSLPAWKPPKD